MSEWSTERISEQYRAEIRAVFEAENAEWRAEEVDAGVADPCDSYTWEFYANSDIQIWGNEVTVLLPVGMGASVTSLLLFERPSVVWTGATIGASIMDGEARLTLRLLLNQLLDR